MILEAAATFLLSSAAVSALALKTLVFKDVGVLLGALTRTRFRRSKTTWWWYKEAATLYSALFRLSSLPRRKRKEYMKFFVNHLVPNFGPSPPEFWSLPNETSYRPTLRTPIEVIWVLGDSKRPMSVRFGTEFLNPATGIPRNPEDTLAIARDLFSNPLMREFDPTWGDVCYDTLVYHDWRLLKHGHHTIQYFVGGEFGVNGLVAKQYYHPTVRAQETSTPAFEVVANCMDRLGLRDQFDPVLQFFAAHPQYEAVPEFLGVEAVAPERNRIKCYIRIHRDYSSLDQVVFITSLGGVLKDKAVQPTIDAFKRLWRLLYPTHGDNENVESLRPGSKGMLIYFEMGLDRVEPIPKIYIPVYRFAGNDDDVAGAVQQYYRETNQGGEEENNYLKHFKSLFPKIPNTTTSPWAQSYIGIATKKGTTQMTMYYALDAYGVAR